MRQLACSTSDSVVNAETLRRIDPSTTPGGSPIASKTGERSLDPLAQAEPVEHAIFAMSKAIMMACRSSPGNATFNV
jgi:hypothetical protein